MNLKKLSLSLFLGILLSFSARAEIRRAKLVILGTSEAAVSNISVESRWYDPNRTTSNGSVNENDIKKITNSIPTHLVPAEQIPLVSQHFESNGMLAQVVDLGPINSELNQRTPGIAGGLMSGTPSKGVG